MMLRQRMAGKYSCRIRPGGLSNMWESTETGFLLHLFLRVMRSSTALEVTLRSIFNDSFDLVLFTRRSAFGAMTF